MSARDEHDDDPTAEELAEAAALARALEARAGGAPAGTPPEDALATAALLRAAAAPSLSPERLAAAAQPGRAAVRQPGLAAADQRRPSRRWWLLPTLLVPTLAVATLVLAPSYRAARLTKRDGDALPAPPRPLLEAQARAARGKADLGALDRQMRDYRAAYLAALAEEDAQ